MTDSEALSILREVQGAVAAADGARIEAAEEGLARLRAVASPALMSMLARTLRVTHQVARVAASSLEYECARLTVDSFGYTATGASAAERSAFVRGTFHG
ncbi:MAG TPA: hypothetical protein VES20_22365 [Bryobacteraceae bacterium]|nr:hypothetical protein [Bryobacteraceae bacterium]